MQVRNSEYWQLQMPDRLSVTTGISDRWPEMPDWVEMMTVFAETRQLHMPHSMAMTMGYSDWREQVAGLLGMTAVSGDTQKLRCMQCLTCDTAVERRKWGPGHQQDAVPCSTETSMLLLMLGTQMQMQTLSSSD